MPWPPSLPSVGFKNEGLSTYVWGTDGFASLSTGVGSYIIKSVRAEERADEPVIENGTGLTAAQILLLDGINWEITVVDNTAFAPPIAGAICNVVIPQLGMNGVSNNAVVTGEVMPTSVNLARKTDGERVIRVKNFVLFTPS